MAVGPEVVTVNYLAVLTVNRTGLRAIVSVRSAGARAHPMKRLAVSVTSNRVFTTAIVARKSLARFARFAMGMALPGRRLVGSVPSNRAGTMVIVARNVKFQRSPRRLQQKAPSPRSKSRSSLFSVQ